MKKFDLDDVLIKPSVLSKVRSRTDIKILDEYGKLPLITAPMDTVYFEEKNSGHLFNKNGLWYTVPRNNEKILDTINNVVESRLHKTYFISLSLEEFEILANNKFNVLHNIKSEQKISRLFSPPMICLLVDIANGHMEHLYDLVKKFKSRSDIENFVLMVGNVANPETYKKLSDSGADYVRMSIGSGSACLTSVQTAIGYPMGSLIEESYNISLTMENPAKIVADGGFKSYADIIKALALGADYVMIGSIINKCIDTYGEIYWKNINISKYPKLFKFLFNKGVRLKKKYRGMSTKEVQMAWGKNEVRTSEGVVKYNDIEYTLEGWLENFSDYLRSAMSYTGSFNLDEFKGSEIIHITRTAHKRFDK